MRGGRVPIGAIVLAPILLLLGVYAFTAQGQVDNPDATPTATASATVASARDAAALTAIAAHPTPTPIWTEPTVEPFPTDTPTPLTAAEHGPFHDRAWVRVNAGAGDCLNARSAPSLEAQYVIVNSCLPHGYEGMLTGTATEAEGHWWWRLAGAGYVAEEYLVYVRDVAPGETMAPHLGGAGRIAFIRDGGIWVMNADGSDQREVVPLPTDSNGVTMYPTNVAWSPDGTRLSYNTQSYDASSKMSGDLHVVSLDGTSEMVARGVMGRSWSPDGNRIGAVKGRPSEGPGSSYQGTPGWVEVPSGQFHALSVAPEWADAWQQEPPQFDATGSMLLTTFARYDDAGVGGAAIPVFDTSGQELERIDVPQDMYYQSPRWSPDSHRISFHVSDQDRPYYAVYDLAQHAIVAQAAVPARNPNMGGRCGSADMWRSEWTRDGTSVLYSYDAGLGGTNGIWAWNPTTGEQRLSPAPWAGAPSAGPDGRFVFSADSFILAGDAAGGLPVVITDGYSPVWSP